MNITYDNNTHDKHICLYKANDKNNVKQLMYLYMLFISYSS